MLKIFNDLEPFLKDNYRRINVREYARIRNISPPSASKLLSYLHKEDLLDKEEEKNYIYFVANKENKLFINLLISYWSLKIKESGFIGYIEKELINPLIIMFGSFSKAEINQKSDIDLAIFTISKKQINPEKFEKKLNRKIQTFIFKNKEEIKNRELLYNILNGFIILGEW